MSNEMTPREAMAEEYPLKRLGVPDDIGSVVAFLLSDDAAWMTGSSILDWWRGGGCSASNC